MFPNGCLEQPFFKCLLNLGCITLDRGRKWKWTRWSLESLSGQIETGISRVHGPIAYKICSLPSPYTFGVGSHEPLFSKYLYDEFNKITKNDIFSINRYL